MDEKRYRLRDLIDADFGPLARIWTLTDPERPITEKEIRAIFRWGEEPRFFRYRRSVVEVGSETLVAAGAIWQNGITFHPEFAWVGVSVDPAHQHRGIGRELFRDLEQAARDRPLKVLWASVRSDDSRAVRYFEQAGFREKRRTWTSKLDVTTLAGELRPRSPEQWTRDGIVFTTAEQEGPDRPEVRLRMHQLCLDAMKDVPRMSGGHVDYSLDGFVQAVFGGPGYLPEAIFLARVGEAYVAFSVLFRHSAEPEVLHVLFTGTLPAYRGRGLAGELKRRSIEFARTHGYRYIQTDNDSENERIWSINRQLGFRQYRVWVSGEKRLAAA